MRVVCTAGHVDHGKSTLVRALTGMEPDRLAEERRRGLTIELGFVWADLEAPRVPPAPTPRTVAFVDLPGHERFVATMLAGAGGVDVALFVVAADEGWKPQSQEHLDVLGLLGVRHAVVAVTKADAVDADRCAATLADVRARLAGTPLAGAPAVAVSAATGAGLDALVVALLRVLDDAGEPEDRGRARLWVDRSFSVRGAGTVVTGTLGGGRLAAGDEVLVLPGGRRARVRGLETLRRPAAAAAPGNRVALNLSGLERTAVGRGDAVVRPGAWPETSIVEARVRVLPGCAVGRRGAWHLHAGSGERVARLGPLLPGDVTGQGDLRIELDRALPLAAGDRFVLRDAGRRATVGGGVVLDPDPPPPPRGRPARLARVVALDAREAALRAGDRAALVGLAVRERGHAPVGRTAAAAGVHPDGVDAALRAASLLVLTAAGVAHAVAPRAAATWSTATSGALAAHHAGHPLDRLAPRGVALTALRDTGCPDVLTAPFLDALIRTGRVVADGPGVRTPAHAVALDPAAVRARTALLHALGQEPFRPPALAAAAAAAGASPALLRELEAAGDLVRLGADMAVLAGTLDTATERLRTAAAGAPFTASWAKDVLGTSRKYALPLLEELDRRGRTRRTGDLREVRG